MDWVDAVSKDHASNQRVTVDISGGTEILRYSFVAAVYNERGILERDKSESGILLLSCRDIMSVQMLI